jgi:hypothetical protein
MAVSHYVERQRPGRDGTGGMAYLVVSTVVLTIGIAPDVYLGWWCVPAYIAMFVCIPAAGIAARRNRLSQPWGTPASAKGPPTGAVLPRLHN